jgi:hypothetical protein
MSMIEQPIKEDSEFEEADNYMSDSSSSSQFSLRKRYLTLDLAKLIDRLEPLDNRSGHNDKYYGNVEETIEEELSSSSNEKANEKGSKSSFLSSTSSNKRRKRFLLSSEPIGPLQL